MKDNKKDNTNWLENNIPAGFTVPDDYFERVEDNIFTTLETENFPKKEGYTVPNNYFDNLEDKILEKVQPKGRIIPLRKKILQWTPAIAAAVVIAFTSILFVGNKTSADLTQEEIISWLEDHPSISFNVDSDLAMVFEETDFNDQDITLNVSDSELEIFFDNEDYTTLLNDIEE